VIAPFRLPLRPRTLITGGLFYLLVALAVAALVPVVFGRPLPKVHLTWRGIEPGARQALESRFKLSEPQRVDDTTWSYVPLDRSPDTYRGIVTHPAVEDTAGIDRRTFEEADGPPLTERRGGLWPGAPSGPARARRSPRAGIVRGHRSGDRRDSRSTLLASARYRTGAGSGCVAAHSAGDRRAACRRGGGVSLPLARLLDDRND